MRHWAEEVARDHLLRLGYRLLSENASFKGGELDLVMEEGDVVVFVEVRQRKGRSFGSPGESIDRRKLTRLQRSAQQYLLRHRLLSRSARIDAVLVEGTRHRHSLIHLKGVH